MNITKILLVDDDPNILLIAEIGLEDTPEWQIITATSGPEALEKAAAEQPDVILLDMMMPGMDGKIAFARLRENPATALTPVVFMTAKVQMHEVDSYLTIGAAGVIMKPFDPMKLSFEIKSIFSTPGSSI